MKQKYWRIIDGEVVQDGPFAIMSDGVHARTKGEATLLLLKELARRKANNPIVRIENGAFNLVWHNGREFISESGRCDRSESPMCVGGHLTLASALADKTFQYYASEEYTKALDKQAAV
jgi:hypothetical protein